MVVAAPKKTPAKSESKSGKRKQGPRGPRSTRRVITCFLCGMEGHVQRRCPFRLMSGITSAQMPPGLAQLSYPALPMPPGPYNQYQDQSGPRQGNYKADPVPSCPGEPAQASIEPAAETHPVRVPVNPDSSRMEN